MDSRTELVDCSGTTFETVKYTFDYHGADRDLLDEILSEAEERAKNVNAAQANTSQRRGEERRISDNARGVLAEYVWKHWLNQYAEENGIDARVESRQDWDRPEEEVDLTLVHDDGRQGSIEVRSSCAYAKFENVVCDYFDIMGWYTNAVKRGEKRKDYYARVIYPFHRSDFDDEFESGSLEVYLTGGATRRMLETSEHAVNKTMNKDSDKSRSKGDYRAIEPISNGLDMDAFPRRLFD